MATDLKKIRCETAPRPPLADLPPNTPPRRTRRQAEHPQERVSWGQTLPTGCTPCRGRAANDIHRMREKACDGRVLMYRVGDPDNPKKRDVCQPCRLCKAKTAFYCSGCKNWLCFGSSGITADKATKIKAGSCLDEDSSLAHFIKVPVAKVGEENTDWAFLHATNTCYHAMHKESFSRLV